MTTFERVRRLLAQLFGVPEDRITPETRVMDLARRGIPEGREDPALLESFVSDLGADWLDLVEFAVAVEEEFDVELSEDEVSTTITEFWKGRDTTVLDIVDFIDRKRGE